MKQADLIIAGCRQLLTCGGGIPKRKAELRDVGVIENAWIASHQGRIVYIGPEEGAKAEVKLSREGTRIDGSDLVGLPGFIDSHTHLPFAGSREEEFALRIKGYTYQQLAEAGMGIRTTVRATRQISKNELKALCLKRLDQMLQLGTTTAEAKSGYGLNLEDELKQLEVIREVGQSHPVDLVPTFMGAHEVPEEYRSRKEDYIDLLIHKIIPEVRKKDLARFFDVFCEKGVFSVEETERLVQAAQAAGFRLKIHADEFAALGGAELAAKFGAASADHLIAITEAGIQALARSTTVATLLPGVSFFLMQEKKAPARRLIDEGAVVALASDFNPGSSMMESMLFVLQLGVFTLKMTIEEALNAVTANPAYALGLQDEVGTLEVGKKMDLVLCEIPSYLFLVYHLGINPIKHVIKNGRLVVKDGRLIDTA
ncbi:MAG: imidazolonepropionase [Candidatus Aminicenantes bacterium]|nr:imidazolonepropionase [Candidatus Aminicenantes bacterium]